MLFNRGWPKSLINRISESRNESIDNEKKWSNENQTALFIFNWTIRSNASLCISYQQHGVIVMVWQPSGADPEILEHIQHRTMIRPHQ